MSTVAVTGLAILIILAIVVGTAVGREARDEAWTRIATARRIRQEGDRRAAEREIALDAWEDELDRRDRRLAKLESQLSERESLLAQRERGPEPPEGLTG